MKQIEEETEQFSVLVIEDNLGDFVLVEDYLLDKFKQISIKHCLNYYSSIEYLKAAKEKPSIILLDLKLPDMEGLELISNILENNFNVPVIILTGYSDLALAKSSLKIGIYDYLLKDEINPFILFKTVVFALNRSRYINQIEEEKRNYENLFNFNPQPTWLINAKTLKILNANLAAQKIYGYSLEEFMKMGFTQLHPPLEEQLVSNKLTLKEVVPIANQFTHCLSDGKKINVEIYFKKVDSILYDGIIVQSNDISEILSHINTIEIQNNKFKQIAWTQSHEVRGPLARILGVINLIEMSAINEDELEFFLKQLKISGNELDDVIKKITEQTKQS